MLRGGLRRRCILTRASAQQAHAAGTDEQSEHDEDDAENDFATNDCDDAADDKEDREDPQDEVHGRSVPPPMTFKRVTQRSLSVCASVAQEPAVACQGQWTRCLGRNCKRLDNRKPLA